MVGPGLIAFNKLCVDSILEGHVAVDVHRDQQGGLYLRVQLTLPFKLRIICQDFNLKKYLLSL